VKDGLLDCVYLYVDLDVDSYVDLDVDSYVYYISYFDLDTLLILVLGKITKKSL
jgi:hypothetical protein